jgi:hypothetical protein
MFVSEHWDSFKDQYRKAIRLIAQERGEKFKDLMWENCEIYVSDGFPGQVYWARTNFPLGRF